MTLNHNCGCFSTVAGIAGNGFALRRQGLRMRSLSVLPNFCKYKLIFKFSLMPCLRKTIVSRCLFFLFTKILKIIVKKYCLYQY